MAEVNQDLIRIWEREGTSSTVDTPLGDWVYSTNIHYSTPQLETTITVDKDKTGIHPRLYFKYLKSKLNFVESQFLKRRMKQLEKLVDEYAKLGQEALSEWCVKQFLVISKESAILACGLNKFITQEHVDKFRYKLRGTSLKITPLKNFARPLPKRVADKVKKCMEKKLFDRYEIFHLDDKAVKPTEKERIERERDPIIFGRIEYSERYYFIADWEDELDDLKLEDIIKKLSLKKDQIVLKNRLSQEDLKK